MRNDLNKANSNAKAWLTKFSQHQTGSDFQRLRVVMGTQIRKHGEKTPTFLLSEPVPTTKNGTQTPTRHEFLLQIPENPGGKPDFFHTQPKPDPTFATRIHR